MPTLLIPDASPLITLAYAEALDLLCAPGWPVWIVDMVRHELTRSQTPTSARIGHWIQHNAKQIVSTETFLHHQSNHLQQGFVRHKANLGELAAQEAMISLARMQPGDRIVFLFEDHRIARAGFVVPQNCMKISTRAYLQFLEQSGKIVSANAVERAAVENGRAFSKLHYPPPEV